MPVANVVSLGPTVVHVLEVLGIGVLYPEVNVLVICLLGFIGCGATGGCFVVVGQVLELFAEQLEFFGLVSHLCHESLVGGCKVGKHGPICSWPSLWLGSWHWLCGTRLIAWVVAWEMRRSA